MTTEFTKIIAVFSIGFMIAMGLSVSAFVYPDSAPPTYSGTNPIYAPITVGAVENNVVVGQSKLGGLALCTGWSVDVNCVVSGGVIYSKGDLELETGIITPVNGSAPAGPIYLNAPGGVVLPTVSGSAVSGVADGTMIFDDDTNTLKVWVGGQWREIVTNP